MKLTRQRSAAVYATCGEDDYGMIVLWRSHGTLWHAEIFINGNSVAVYTARTRAQVLVLAKIDLNDDMKGRKNERERR